MKAAHTSSEDISQPFRQILAVSRSRTRELIAKRRTLSHYTVNSYEVRTLGLRILRDHLGGLAYPGPEAKLWLDGSGVKLFRDPESRALVNLAIDGQRTSNSLFTVTGKEVAWGNRDGTVTVCELE